MFVSVVFVCLVGWLVGCLVVVAAVVVAAVVVVAIVVVVIVVVVFAVSACTYCKKRRTTTNTIRV